MKFSAILALLPLAVVGTQVNFYSDTTCGNFIGSANLALDDIKGGPFGSRSMLFVTNDQSCSHTCGPNLIFCKNSECNAWDVTSGTGVCKTFQNGVWASTVCGCLGCTSGCSGSL